MIVVATNIIAYHLLPSPYTDKTIQLRRLDAHWIAPVLWASELKNVLAMYIRQNLITLGAAISLCDEARFVVGSVAAVSTADADILNLVAVSTCSSYDCEFVALAQSLNTKLITQDKKILHEFPKVSCSLSTALVQLNNED